MEFSSSATAASYSEIILCFLYCMLTNVHRRLTTNKHASISQKRTSIYVHIMFLDLVPTTTYTSLMKLTNELSLIKK